MCRSVAYSRNTGMRRNYTLDEVQVYHRAPHTFTHLSTPRSNCSIANPSTSTLLGSGRKGEGQTGKQGAVNQQCFSLCPLLPTFTYYWYRKQNVNTLSFYCDLLIFQSWYIPHIVAMFKHTIILPFLIISYTPLFTDNPDLLSHVPITIQVLDVNDNPPEIKTEDEILICESIRAGQVSLKRVL